MYLLPLIALSVSFWPVWAWYGERVLDGSDEPYGILALVAALAILVAKSAKRSELPESVLLTLAGISVAYALVAQRLPLLFQGLVFALCLSAVLSQMFFARKLHLGLLGLLVLSLPLIASLQFFMGFPLRFITAKFCAEIISCIGFPVHAEGTLLHWRGELVALDAPCTGIRMLWSGLFLHFLLSSWRGMGNKYTLLGYSLSMLIIFGGNLIRTVLLFFTESRIVRAPEWMHAGIGLFSFMLVASAIIFMHQRFQSRCAQ